MTEDTPPQGGATAPGYTLPEYILDEQVGFALRKAYQRHTTIFARMIGEDITAIQFSTLYRLVRATEPMSQNALGRSVAMDAATTKGVVSRLRDRNLISMRPDEVDRRRHLLEATPEGHEMIARTLPRMREITRETLAPLPPEAADSLLHLLHGIA